MLDLVLKFVGLLEYDARLLAIKENILLRVVEIDGEYQTHYNQGINLERINLVLENGVVRRAYLG